MRNPIFFRSIARLEQHTPSDSFDAALQLVCLHYSQSERAAEIAATLQAEFFGKLKAPVARLGAPYAPVPFSKPLEDAYAPNAKRIAEAAITLTK